MGNKFLREFIDLSVTEPFVGYLCITHLSRLYPLYGVTSRLLVPKATVNMVYPIGMKENIGFIEFSATAWV